MATDTDSDSTTEYAETTPRTGIARCAPLDGQTAPYTVHGVAIGPKDVTNGAGGDLGIPALGSGSHADPIGTEYERFLDDQITRGAEDLAVEVRSAGLSVSNNYDKSGVMGTVEQAVHVGQQDVEFTATVAGQFAQHEHLHEHLTAQDFDIT